MKKLVLLAVSLTLVAACAGQSVSGKDGAPPPAVRSQMGLAPLMPPYVISTAPNFAVWVQFPRADSIRRIALGNSNYFLAEADKDDPHYAILKQIRTSKGKGKAPIATNMLVYMASGRVINITLRAGELAEAAYLIDYPVARREQNRPAPPSAAEVARAKQEQVRTRLAEEMLGDVKEQTSKQPGSVAGGLNLRLGRIERLGEVAMASFAIENVSQGVVDLEGPQVNLVTLSDKKKDGKKLPANVEPIQFARSVISLRQLVPGARAAGLIEFKPPVHDSNQQVVLSVSNRAMADQPATIRIE